MFEYLWIFPHIICYLFFLEFSLSVSISLPICCYSVYSALKFCIDQVANTVTLNVC